MTEFFKVEGLWLNVSRIRSVNVEERDGDIHCAVYLVGAADSQRLDCKGETARRLLKVLEAREAK